MKYFIDTEFLEGMQKRWFGGETTKPTIDLISIGIVCEDGRKYYSVFNDFNFDEAWYRYEQRTGEGDNNNRNPRKYWIRDNVLRKIWLDYIGGEHKAHFYPFTYKNMKAYFKKHGRSRAQVANDICAFTLGFDCGGSGMSAIEMAMKYELSDKTKAPEFYAYYCAYDWVAFCWIFGKMKDLPKDFPMYCRDLKQIFDEKVEIITAEKMLPFAVDGLDKIIIEKGASTKTKNHLIKTSPSYPVNKNEHHALSDATWDFELYKFLKTI